VLIVIPARSGSKRIPGKNIAPLLGKPLLVYTVEAAIAAGVTPHVTVSTESAEIAEVAHGAGARVIPRPDELAADEASTEAVLLHVLEVLEGEGLRFAWVITLPPTSPLRTAGTIRTFVERVRAEPDLQDCLMSVTENRCDFWRGEENGTLRRLFPDAPRRQQDRVPLYEENSAIYITRVQALRETGRITGRKVRGLAIDRVEALDINEPIDMKIAEALLSERIRAEG
jgi:CMP-N-acetylneuraminic acid synthetase